MEIFKFSHLFMDIIFKEWEACVSPLQMCWYKFQLFHYNEHKRSWFRLHVQEGSEVYEDTGRISSALAYTEVSLC